LNIVYTSVNVDLGGIYQGGIELANLEKEHKFLTQYS
jgi:hypothetical protein